MSQFTEGAKSELICFEWLFCAEDIILLYNWILSIILWVEHNYLHSMSEVSKACKI